MGGVVESGRGGRGGGVGKGGGGGEADAGPNALHMLQWTHFRALGVCARVGCVAGGVADGVLDTLCASIPMLPRSIW